MFEEGGEDEISDMNEEGEAEMEEGDDASDAENSVKDQEQSKAASDEENKGKESSRSRTKQLISNKAGLAEKVGTNNAEMKEPAKKNSVG